ncbi:putative inactive heme oxygenase 2, chloroplastic [Sesamum angolense]|uniref:Inactive heme oxygenase 2, chloroplastic n=1 Tax=Sesamum angolense TaxID=2727404 RepID=A0AAE1W678_9LAMI|nr:putative inactive heme oxygenase 2, chloroplastic [Sesamum angolense]
MKQTAASVLWQSLRSVMSSANHEVRAGFELRVAALLADIVAASDSRRAAIVGAGGGAVVDWLLETVAVPKDGNGTQAESARALAYLIADPNVCEAVFGRPQAVPNLLRFIFSAQPPSSKKALLDEHLDRIVVLDVIVEKLSLKPLLPKNADIRDIAAAIEVIEEGGMHWDEKHGGEDDDDGGQGMKGIGMKVLGGTTVLGLSGTGGFAEVDHSDSYNTGMLKSEPKNQLLNKINESSPTQANLSSSVIPGLWDDLHSEHVAVPFAAWALANWAMASEVNRSHIQELDQDGHAVMSALMAPERSVKWHGSWLAQLLLEDRNLPLNDSVSSWSSSLLSTISQASKNQDIPLAQVALSALLVSIERSPEAQEVVMDKGLPSMREAARQTVKHKPIQEALAKALELISSRELYMCLEESQKWSPILLSWVFGKVSSDTIRSSAINILSHILEDYGPSSVPISQGWLTILLTDTLSSKKAILAKGSAQVTSDKVKTQVDLANVVSATQTANQLARSFKNLKKDKPPKITAADSALATLKGIKALTDICAEDPLSQQKIADFGVLCLLRRLLLEDDYEQLAAIEAYDASRALEAQGRVSSSPSDPSVVDSYDPSNLRVPATAHIRRHAARLLTVLSVLPEVQKAIVADKSWCKWLEECARGQIPGCNDLKIQSYARATLLNAFCSDPASWKSENDGDPDSSALIKNLLIHLSVMILLREIIGCFQRTLENDNPPPASTSGSESFSNIEVPPLDVVFVHGLRGGPFKTWRLSEDKSSTKSGLVEKIDEEAGKQGTFWPGEWLAADFPPHARLFSLKYKTNLTQWSGASLPLQEVSSMLLDKLVAAAIGDRPVVFVTHSFLLMFTEKYLAMHGRPGCQADVVSSKGRKHKDNFVNNTVELFSIAVRILAASLQTCLGVWVLSYVLHPLLVFEMPQLFSLHIGELRSGSPRLVELNDFIRQLYKKKLIDVLSFCETKVTPIVEGYGGWAFRMEIVPMESAYPGFGELVVLDSTDHVNSCKPLSRADPSYKDTLEFLQKLKSVASASLPEVLTIAKGMMQSKNYGDNGTILIADSADEAACTCRKISGNGGNPILLQCTKFSSPVLFVSETESECETEEYSSSEEYAEGEDGQAPRMVGNGQTPPPVKRQRRRYRKQYPGEKKGITEEMRFVAMKLRNSGKVKRKNNSAVDGESEEEETGNVGGEEDNTEDSETWRPSMEGFLKYLVDSELVFSTVERIVDESSDVSYVYFRKTGLERSDCISRDLKWLSEQGNVIPEPSNPGITYVQYLEELAEKTPPLFLCHFYNIYFSHIAGGQVIAKQDNCTGFCIVVQKPCLRFSSACYIGFAICLKEAIRRKRTGVLPMGGRCRRVVERVREKLNALGEHWSRDEKNKCLREATKAFRFLGQMVSPEELKHERFSMEALTRVAGLDE